MQSGVSIEPAAGTTSTFVVVVHDVTPVFAREIDRIVDGLSRRVGRSLGAAIVPNWHGREAGPGDVRQFQEWRSRVGELLLHGWTHFRTQTPGLISALTDRADEFGGLSPQASTERLVAAQSVVQSLLGETLCGFVPPAWQFTGPPVALRSAGVDYVLGFQRLRGTAGGDLPLATWSWDWGGFPGSSTPGAWLGTAVRLVRPSSIPVVVLHPMDVRRGCLPLAMRRIEGLLDEGLEPVLPSELVAHAVAFDEALVRSGHEPAGGRSDGALAAVDA
jgi:hypothetical protein